MATALAPEKPLLGQKMLWAGSRLENRPISRRMHKEKCSHRLRPASGAPVFANGAVTAAMAYAFNQLSEDFIRRHTTDVETVMSTTGETFVDFAKRLGTRLVELTEDSGFEYTAAFAKRADVDYVDGYQYGVVVQTQGSHVFSASTRIPGGDFVAMQNHLGQNLTIHSHGLSGGRPTAVDEAFLPSRSGSKIRRVPNQDRYNFSTHDHQHPGLLATPSGVKWLRPDESGRLRSHGL